MKIIYHSLFGSHWVPKHGGKRPQRHRLLFKHYKTIPFRKLPLKNAEILLTCIYLHDKFCLPHHDIYLYKSKNSKIQRPHHAIKLSFCVFTGTKSSTIVFLRNLHLWHQPNQLCIVILKIGITSKDLSLKYSTPRPAYLS